MAFELLMNDLQVRRHGPGRPRTRPDELLADKAYSSKAIRSHLRGRGIRATIPLKSDQQAGRRRRGAQGRLPAFDADFYRQRNVVERAVNKLRSTRAVATRYDKRDFVYRGTIDVAAIRIWLRDRSPQIYGTRPSVLRRESVGYMRPVARGSRPRSWSRRRVAGCRSRS